MDDRLKY